MPRALPKAAVGGLFAVVLFACSAPSSSPAAATGPTAPAATSAPARATAAPASATKAPGAASTAAPAAAKGGGQQLYPITVSYASPALSDLPFYAALAQGFFQQQGLDVKMERMRGDAAITALSKGEIQFTDAPGNAIEGAFNGLPLRVVYSAWASAPWTLVGKQQYHSLGDLRGKIVGTNQPGSNPYLYLQAGLKREGLTIQDLSVRTLGGTQETYTALLAGQIEAGVLSPPFDIEAEDHGFHQVAFLGDALKSPYVGMGANTAFIRDHRPQVVAFIRAIQAASRWAKAHPDGAATLVEQNVKVSPSVAQRAVAKMLPLLSDTGEVSLEGVQQAIDAEAALTKKPATIKAADAVDLGPLQEAQRQQ